MISMLWPIIIIKVRGDCRSSWCSWRLGPWVLPFDHWSLVLLRKTSLHRMIKLFCLFLKTPTPNPNCIKRAPQDYNAGGYGPKKKRCKLQDLNVRPCKTKILCKTCWRRRLTWWHMQFLETNKKVAIFRDKSEISNIWIRKLSTTTTTIIRIITRFQPLLVKLRPWIACYTNKLTIFLCMSVLNAGNVFEPIQFTD